MSASGKASVLPVITTPDGKAVRPNKNAADDLQKVSDSELTAGWLYKWTNYLKGYRKRWFVLQNGVLSYYRNQAAANRGAPSRGTIQMRDNSVRVAAYERDCLVIVLHVVGASRVYLKAPSELERTRWFAALWAAAGDRRESHQADVSRVLERREEGETEAASLCGRDEEERWPQLEAESKLAELKACVDALAQQETAFERDLWSLLEVLQANGAASRAGKALAERAALLRVAAASALRVCDDVAVVAAEHSGRCQRQMQHEKAQRRGLETLVEQLAWQHRSFERQARKSLRRAARGEKAKTSRGWLKRASHGDALTKQTRLGLESAVGHSRSSQQLTVESSTPSRMVVSATHTTLTSDCNASTSRSAEQQDTTCVAMSKSEQSLVTTTVASPTNCPPQFCEPTQSEDGKCDHVTFSRLRQNSYFILTCTVQSQDLQDGNFC